MKSNVEFSSLTTSDTAKAAAPVTGATIRPVSAEDLAAIQAIHESSLGPGRYSLTAYRVREGTPAISPYCRVSILNGKLVGAIRFTPIVIGDKPGAVLLGPLAVAPAHVNTGIGRELIAAGVKAAADDGVQLVVLVGDAAYYQRVGFVPVPFGQILMPGPVNPARIMAFEMVPGALAQFSGLIAAA